MTADADSVLAIVADVAAYPEWADGVKSADVLEADADGRPLRARFEVSSGFVQGWYVIAYDWSTPGRVAWSLVESPLLKTMDGAYDVAATDQGVDVTYSLTLEPTMPMIGPLRRAAERALIRTALDDLATRAGS
jgi:ribosome-associated toxin RatA of RatAB toxin-antitoxin module